MSYLLYEEDNFSRSDIKKENDVSKKYNLEELKEIIKKELTSTNCDNDDYVNSDDNSDTETHECESESKKYIEQVLDGGNVDDAKELYEYCKKIDKRLKITKIYFKNYYNNRHVNILRWLYEEKKAFKSKKIMEYDSIFHRACIAGSLDIIKYIISILEKKNLIKKEYNTPIDIIRQNAYSLENELVIYLFKVFNNNNVDAGIWLYEYLKSKNIVSTNIFNIKARWTWGHNEGYKTFYQFLIFSSAPDSIKFMTKKMKECLSEEDFQECIHNKIITLCKYAKHDLYPQKHDVFFSSSTKEEQVKFNKNFGEYFGMLYTLLTNKEEINNMFTEMLFVKGKDYQYIFEILYCAEHHNIPIDWNKLNIDELHYGMNILYFLDEKKITENDLIKVMLNYVDSVIKENEKIFGESCYSGNNDVCLDSKNICEFFERIYYLISTNTQFKKELIEKIKEKKYKNNSLLIYIAKYCYMFGETNSLKMYNILNTINAFTIISDDILDNMIYIKEWTEMQNTGYDLVEKFGEFYRYLCEVTNQMEKMFIYKEEKHKNVYYMYFTLTKYNKSLTEMKYIDSKHREIPYLDGDEIKYFGIEQTHKYF